MQEVLERRFSLMGAAVHVVHGARETSVDVRGDRFVVRLAEGCEAAVVHLDARGRHLLLMTREGESKAKFLCGHDERHWFVAAVPERAAATTVTAAKIALQPKELQEALKKVRRKKRGRRRNEAFVRQGEWFFIPAPKHDASGGVIEHNAPLSRGLRSKPHIVQELCRFGGITEYELRGPGDRRMVSSAEWDRMPANDPRKANAIVRTRDAKVHARGTVRHPDHATISLAGWHRVEMNTENEAAAMRHVVFYD